MQNPMPWIAGWIPLLSFVVPFILYWFTGRTWIGTLFTIVATFAALWFIFSMNFWPWLLLYLFLCWLACWFANMVRSGKLFPKQN